MQDPNLVQNGTLQIQNSQPQILQAQNIQAQNPQQQNQGNQETSSLKTIYYFERRTYDECITTLIGFSSCILGYVQDNPGQMIDREKLGQVLNVFINNCMRVGPSEVDQKVPDGSNCEHLYSKGKVQGTKCGKPAKFIGIDGLPKCSSHKTSKAAKDESGNTALTPGAAAGQTNFSYAASVGKGKVAPQSLTTIQASIMEQTEPAKLELNQLPDGRIVNPATRFEFIQKPDNGWIAVGVIEDLSTPSRKLTKLETGICLGNRWKWDPSRVEGDAIIDHPLTIGANHPLVNGESFVMHKITSVQNNNNPK